MGRSGSSTTPGNGRQSVIKYQATYRLESQNCYNREKCDNILKLVVDKAMKTFEYTTAEEAITLCESLSADIKSRVKLLEFDRYKIICTVTIGNRHMQSFNHRLNFLWDSEKDGFTYYIYDNQVFYLIATIFALYCE